MKTAQSKSVRYSALLLACALLSVAGAKVYGATGAIVDDFSTNTSTSNLYSILGSASFNITAGTLTVTPAPNGSGGYGAYGQAIFDFTQDSSAPQLGAGFSAALEDGQSTLNVENMQLFGTDRDGEINPDVYVYLTNATTGASLGSGYLPASDITLGSWSVDINAFAVSLLGPENTWGGPVDYTPEFYIHSDDPTVGLTFSEISATPEPTTWALLVAGGLLTICMVGRRASRTDLSA